MHYFGLWCTIFFFFFLHTSLSAVLVYEDSYKNTWFRLHTIHSMHSYINEILFFFLFYYYSQWLKYSCRPISWLLLIVWLLQWSINTVVIVSFCLKLSWFQSTTFFFFFLSKFIQFNWWHMFLDNCYSSRHYDS